MADNNTLKHIEKILEDIRRRQARFAGYSAYDFPLNENWRPIVFEKYNLVVPAGARMTLLDVPNEAGWFSAAIGIGNNPLLTVIVTTDMFQIVGNPYQVYTYGLTDPNNNLPWLSVYDLVGSRYVINMNPSPEIAYRSFFKFEVYNPTASAITIERLIVTRIAVEYTKPVFDNIKGE